MLRSLPMLALAAGLVSVIDAAATADSINLRASVRLPDGDGVVLLSQVADLEGNEAIALADLVIAEPPVGVALVEISIGEVRTRLDAAGVHWGRVNLSGRAVLVRRRTADTAGAPLAMQGLTLDDARPRTTPAGHGSIEHLAAAVIDTPTLLGAIARTMTRGIGVGAEDLRLRFDGVDAALLQQTDDDVRFEIDQESSLRSDRVTLTVRVWSDDRVQRSEKIELRPVIRIRCALLLRDVDREEEIVADSLEIVERWLVPSQADQCCDPASATGRLATRRLKAGEQLDRKHVRRRTLVERGDRVNVRCLVGGVAISLQAEARADGASGDVIELRKRGERTTFLATITGRGEAVVDLSR